MIREALNKNFEKTERVKVIPYAALLLAKTSAWSKQKMYVEKTTEQALELLREEGKILYMPEILNQYIRILEEKQKSCDLITVLRQERKSLLELGKKIWDIL